MKILKLILLSLFAMALTACGGGKGSGLPSQPDQPDTCSELVSITVAPQ